MKTKLLIFGITGDLSTRKLLPALNEIVKTGSYDDLEIIGASRRDVNVEELLALSLDTHELEGRVSIVTMDMSVLADYEKLKDDVMPGVDEQLLVYLAVPPFAATQVVDFMGEAGINMPNVKILFEKPFGVDLESAKDAIERTSRYFDETQLYRIDHYAAKEVAGELARLRMHAEDTRGKWGAETVTRVEVIATEAIDIEGRAAFHEQTGALRDFVQGHLMQLLSLVLMTPKEQNIPEARLNALQSLQIADPQRALRAQYKGYGEEAGNPGSLVETFVRLELRSSDPNWRDVSLVLLTGKALDSKRSRVVIHYTDGYSEAFNEDRIQPPEGLRKLDAYERVIVDAINDTKTVFTTSEEVLRSWEVLALVQEAWSMDDEPLREYPKGASPEEIG